MTGEAPVLSLDGGIVKNVFQQGRSERKPEAYGSRYVEGLSEVRTKPESFFTILGLTDSHHAV